MQYRCAGIDVGTPCTFSTSQSIAYVSVVETEKHPHLLLYYYHENKQQQSMHQNNSHLSLIQPVSTKAYSHPTFSVKYRKTDGQIDTYIHINPQMFCASCLHFCTTLPYIKNQTSADALKLTARDFPPKSRQQFHFWTFVILHKLLVLWLKFFTYQCRSKYS